LEAVMGTPRVSDAGPLFRNDTTDRSTSESNRESLLRLAAGSTAPKDYELRRREYPGPADLDSRRELLPGLCAVIIVRQPLSAEAQLRSRQLRV
jgi:hypothetical protein